MVLVRAFSHFALMFATWLVLSGYAYPLLVISGIVASLLVVVITYRMGALDDEGHPLHLAWRLPLYLPWLAGRIVLANIAVVRIILAPRMALDTGSGWVPAHQASPAGLVAFANSITLTPGTVSLSLHPDRIHVHALSRQGLEELEQGEMDRRVCAMEGRG